MARRSSSQSSRRRSKRRSQRSQSQRRRSTQKRQTGTLHLTSGSPKELRAMSDMIKRGPVAVTLVFSRKCPHCITYMPIWEKLCKTNGRKANMISMEADTYQKTHLASQKQVSSVPTVLYVNKAGEIVEASDPRNMSVMTNTVKLSPGSDLPPAVLSEVARRTSSEATELKQNRTRPMSQPMQVSQPMSQPMPVSQPMQVSQPMSQPKPMKPVNPPIAKPMMNPVIPGTMVSENPLPPIPGMVQSGGNPWAAFLIAARQAAPAAALLGAYSALPAKRASGLPAPRTRRRNRH